MRTPSVSIVIPAYNAGCFLGATLDSVLAQTVRDWECIVVDDGSTDNTAAVAQEYSRRDKRIRLVRQANGGISNARNRGYCKTHPATPFVSFMDADDVWLKHALERLKNELEAHPEAVGAHGIGEYIDAAGQPLRAGEFAQAGRTRFGFDGRQIVPWEVSAPTSFRVLIVTSNIYPAGLALVRRKYLNQAGLFDPRLPIGEDWDLWIRLSRLGDFRFVNDVLLLHRRHEHNTTSNYALMHRQANYVRYKTFHAPENNREQKEVMRRSYRALQMWKIKEKKEIRKKYLKNRQYRRALLTYAHLAGLSWRYLRGFPTPRG